MLESNRLDNAGMVYDFGLMNGTVKEFIDGMDHCYLLWAMENDGFKDFVKTHCDRWIELPFSPSAEQLSMFCYVFIQDILDHTIKQNGEGVVKVKSVRYHETTTGWAECDNYDIMNLWQPDWASQVKFSDEVVNCWSKDLKKIIFNNESIINPKVKQQVKIK